jgi:hypothetical protein
VVDAVDEQLIDPDDVEDDGTAAPSNAHGGEQTTDGEDAPGIACLARHPPGMLNLGGDQPIDKEEIANIARLACNVPGADSDLVRPATEWGHAQLGSLLGTAQAAFSDEGLVDYNTEEAVRKFFQSDAFNCNDVASDCVLSRGLLDNPYAKDLLNSTDRSTGIQRYKWNGESRTRREDHFALKTIIPLPAGTADEFVLISVAELESSRRKVELHENAEKHCKGIKKTLARSLDVQVDDLDNESTKMCSAVLEQTHLARSLKVLAELAVNPTRETNKGLLSTHQNRMLSPHPSTL